MKKSCLYFDKKYKCVSFIVHYKGLTLNQRLIYNLRNGEIYSLIMFLLIVRINIIPGKDLECVRNASVLGKDSKMGGLV